MNFEAAREIMVDSQIRPNDVSDPEFVHAFLNTPREAFVPATRKPVAYSELEIETSEGRALWTPRDTAKLLKAAVSASAPKMSQSQSRPSWSCMPAWSPQEISPMLA